MSTIWLVRVPKILVESNFNLKTSNTANLKSDEDSKCTFF